MRNALTIPLDADPDAAPVRKAGKRPVQLTVRNSENARWRAPPDALLHMRLLQARLGVILGRPVSRSAVIRRALEAYSAMLPAIVTVAEAEVEAGAITRAAKG